VYPLGLGLNRVDEGTMVGELDQDFLIRNQTLAIANSL